MILKEIMRVPVSVVFRWEDGVFGSCDGNNKRVPIVINLVLHQKTDAVRTFIHEILHLIRPKMSERNIRKLEKKVWDSLTAKEHFLLAKKLYARKWRAR